MNALEERCGELMVNLGRLESVTRDQGLQNQIGALDQKATVLAENSAEMKIQLSTMMAGGLCAGVSLVGLAKKLDDLDDRIAKVLGKLETSPEKINDGRDWPQCERLAHEVAKDLSDTLKGAWNGFITRKTLNRVSVFSAFRGLAQFREAINQLESLETKARSRISVLPQTVEEISIIIEIDEKMTRLIQGLQIESEPEEMIDFLKRCASVSGVPLSELTDERLAWLRSKGFEESLRIRG
ncbi:MAG: hypothetical protein U1F81_04590 [Verrucomicrobiaceae bacterium]